MYDLKIWWSMVTDNPSIEIQAWLFGCAVAAVWFFLIKK